ncbi:MAG: hypothetical protein GF332_04190 [Candidatus Moranbacteria bacterium]|nr:hypothetical protein [Candidatus Moranbacteria bacterium]
MLKLHQGLLNKIRKIFFKIGLETLKIYQQSSPEKHYKKDNSPVTKADLISNSILRKQLPKLINLPIVSEEDHDNNWADIKNDPRSFWLIDPLDGTKDFLDKTGDFTVLVSLIINNYVKFGFTYLPIKNQLYYAANKFGAFKIFDHSRVSLNNLNTTELTQKSLVSRHHFSQKEKRILNKLNFKIIKKGSAGLKLALIAENKYNLYVSLSHGLSIWDVSSGALLLKESGGEVTDLHGNKINFNPRAIKLKKGLVASKNIDHKKIIKQISHFIN